MFRVLGSKKGLAEKLAKRLGISMVNNCAWIGPCDKDGFTPFGPDTTLDNIYQSLPQVTLHGMDEGLTVKLCEGVMNVLISEATEIHGMNVASVSWALAYMNIMALFSSV